MEEETNIEYRTRKWRGKLNIEQGRGRRRGGWRGSGSGSGSGSV